MTELVPASLLTDIRRMIDSARARAAAAVNAELTYFIGRLVVGFEMMCCAASARATGNRSSPRSRGN
ncbi:hypothetical protein GA845_16980 [Burkholderia pseudomallei]|nr:hypothetical protein [Burkholderia pseudomallei]NRD82982.1 hypothetical protein [Burkholderia pseudomallei]